MSKDGEQDPNVWWSELKHGGMLLSPAILKEFLPNGPPKKINPLESSYKKLRDAYTAFESWSEQEERTRDTNSGLYQWLDAVFDQFLDYPLPWWQKGNAVSDQFKFQTSTGDRLRPNRVLLERASKANPRFLIRIDTRKGRLGMGKGRVEYSKFLTLLRGTGVPFGIFTNGNQFRLIYAGMDYDCWAEWDVARWFEAESGIDQLEGLVALCGKDATCKTDEDDFPLLSAVLKSRTRQGELSQVLGEQVRRAVEILLRDFDEAIQENPSLLESLTADPITKKEITDSERLEALYHAAIRVIMRLVVVLFAEARELLPKNMEKYHSSYGIEGLYAALEEALRHEGDIGLRESYSAWPRLLGLFRAIHEGCSTEDIPIPRYGGELFKRGDPLSADPILRALAIFEDERWMLNDFVMLEILRLLKIGKVRARRGRASTWVSGPVDFSDLRTEYIGMMYEGVLDYGLKQVSEDEGAVVFLNVGQQPALPLSLLERLSDKELKDFVDKLKKEKTEAVSAEESESEEETEETVSEEELQEELPDELESPEYKASSEIAQERPDDFDVRARKWAEKAVEIGKLLKKPSGKKANLYAYEQEKRKKAKELLLQVYGPGEMYLVRAGGTRKGTGTFYTRPQLAIPTVHRTLEPLAYDKNEDTGELKPKDPETILALKVVDPAMGSGSFLVAALRYLTEALYESLLYHKKIRERSSGGSVITLPFGAESEGGIQEELIPVNPEDDHFEPLLKARLKRHVVERCIYGVDINPLAVELARLSLWVETMDRELPFEFLDHKIKVGNSLVGCWLDRFEDYPVIAWARGGGDGPKGDFTKRIKAIFNEQVKPQMKNWIERIGPQRNLTSWTEEESPVQIQDENSDIYSKLHELKGDAREPCFRGHIQGNENLQHLKKAMDRWCAIWFWPVHNDGIEPLTPDRFYQPNGGNDEIIERITKEIRFFHWELEFPDVFTHERTGFDAVLGNPPWEIMKPNSKEFFTRYDPIYRTYGKQEALKHQKELFGKDASIEAKWILYNTFYKSMGNWVKNVHEPFNVTFARGRVGNKLIRDWENIRDNRSGYASKDSPYRYQGSADLNTYKMFLEVAHHLIKDNGRMGMIAPSGIYTDQGTINLRKLFLDKCDWNLLFGFENRNKIFQIHPSYKFCALISERSGETREIKSSFMNRDLDTWETSNPRYLPIKKEKIIKYSPKSRSILEFLKMRDISIADTIYSNSILISDESESGWRIFYDREIDMTNDSKLFTTIQKVKEGGYHQNEYGLFVNSDNDIYLPLYEGRMIGQFDFSEKKYLSGKGRRAKWIDLPWEEKLYYPQYLMNIDTYINNEKCKSGYKVGFLNVSSSTNTRSMISCLIVDLPCGNSVPVLQLRNKSLEDSLVLCTILNSFAFDFITRLRLGGVNLNWYIVEELPLPKTIPLLIKNVIVKNSASLIMISKYFAKEWRFLREEISSIGNYNWLELWAITDHERLRLRCILDAIVAELYGLDYEDLAWILRDCANPPDKLREISSKLDPKGFWRVDKGKPPELRQTTLTLLAFKRLKEVGLEAFCKEDWQFSEDIQERLGPRFLPWQLEGTPEESWAECEQHAKNILGEEGFRDFIDNLNKSELADYDESVTIKANNIDKINAIPSKQESLLSWEGKE